MHWLQACVNVVQIIIHRMSQRERLAKHVIMIWIVTTEWNHLTSHSIIHQLCTRPFNFRPLLNSISDGKQYFHQLTFKLIHESASKRTHNSSKINDWNKLIHWFWYTTATSSLFQPVLGYSGKIMAHVLIKGEEKKLFKLVSLTSVQKVWLLMAFFSRCHATL